MPPLDDDELEELDDEELEDELDDDELELLEDELEEELEEELELLEPLLHTAPVMAGISALEPALLP